MQTLPRLGRKPKLDRLPAYALVADRLRTAVLRGEVPAGGRLAQDRIATDRHPILPSEQPPPDRT